MNRLEGKVAIIINGSPFVLVVPAIFIDFLTSPEDRNLNSHFANFFRLIRIIALFFAIFLCKSKRNVLTSGIDETFEAAIETSFCLIAVETSSSLKNTCCSPSINLSETSAVFKVGITSSAFLVFST